MSKPELTPEQRAAGDQRGEIHLLRHAAWTLFDKLDQARHPNPAVEEAFTRACHHAQEAHDCLGDALALDTGIPQDLQDLAKRVDTALFRAPGPVQHAWAQVRHAALRPREEVTP